MGVSWVVDTHLVLCGLDIFFARLRRLLLLPTCRQSPVGERAKVTPVAQERYDEPALAQVALALLQVYPLFVTIGLGIGACIYSSARNFYTSPDVKCARTPL